MDIAVFRLRVGQRLGVVPVAGSLSPEDADVIAASYETLMHELLEHGLAWWNSDEDVPDTFAEVLIGMTAAACVDEFTIAEPRRSGLIMQHAFGLPMASVAERRLRALTAVPAGDSAGIEYF